MCGVGAVSPQDLLFAPLSPYFHFRLFLSVRSLSPFALISFRTHFPSFSFPFVLAHASYSPPAVQLVLRLRALCAAAAHPLRARTSAFSAAAQLHIALLGVLGWPLIRLQP